MRSRFPLTAVFCFVLLVLCSAASAQDIFVTPVPNAPFSGVIKVERSIVQRDGSVASFKTTRDIHRDSLGRIYNEARTLLPVSSTAVPQIVRILIYDPQNRLSTQLFPRDRTFISGTVSRPPATVPPALLYASPTGERLPANEFTNGEDLGFQEISGVSVHGVRETQTIPPDKSGTGTEIVISDEYWYSNDLSINMIIKHVDPREGSVTMTVTQVARTEPDAALFEIPEGYKDVRLNHPPRPAQ
jgi:hypothetical protein